MIPAYSEDVVRISLFGDEVEKISLLDSRIIKRKTKNFTNSKFFLQNIILIAKDVSRKSHFINQKGIKNTAYSN